MSYSVIRGALTTRKTLYTLAFTALFITLSIPNLFQPVQAQNITTFTPQETFKNPADNGTIRFAVNGTYTNAKLENGVWTFNNLTLNGSRPLGSLEFSAKNCDVTIYNFYSSNYNPRRLGYLRMYIAGQGEQTVNLGYNASNPSHPSEWSIITRGSVFLAEGENWQLLPGDMINLWGLTGEVTILRYDYGYLEDEGSFYQQHSVIILTAITVALTVTFATLIRLKSKAGQS